MNKITELLIFKLLLSSFFLLFVFSSLYLNKRLKTSKQIIQKQTKIIEVLKAQKKVKRFIISFDSIFNPVTIVVNGNNCVIFPYAEAGIFYIEPEYSGDENAN